MAEFEKSKKQLHIAMLPWLALGHINPYIILSNELARRGHRTSILLPENTSLRLAGNIQHPDLTKFYPLNVPHVDGLPPGAETASDIDISDNNLLAVAFDAMSGQVEDLLKIIKPDIVFYDSAYWIPKLAAVVGFKTVCYMVVGASSIAPIVPRNRQEKEEINPANTPVLRPEDSWTVSSRNFGSISAYDRVVEVLQGCDFISIRTCRELEGDACDYMSKQYNKPVVLTGPVLAESPKAELEEKWAAWLSKFGANSVVYCAFGSQHSLEKKQFQELLLGFEMTGMPFFLALSKPKGANSVEEALPEGFSDRTGERGIVHGGWVPQTQILNHSSVGCFVSHCGFGSMWESLLSDNQIVLLPRLPDQVLNARMLAQQLKVAVEVERDENGWFTKENLCGAVKSAMDEQNEGAKVMKENRDRWRETFSKPGFMETYVEDFMQNLYQL